MRLLKFILSAVYLRCAYIDLDGTLLKRMRVPKCIALHGPEEVLSYWMANLRPTPIVIRRLVLLYILRALGVRLIVWTNRSKELHEQLTQDALGRHVWLFHAMEFYDGEKIFNRPLGPVMDDQKAYVDLGLGWSLLVEQV